MKHLFASLLLGCLLLGSCRNNKEKIPSHILHPDTMAVILTEMQLIEASVSTRTIKNDEQKKGLAFYAQIFKKHNITKEKYDESYLFYSTHPAFLEKIYDSVLVELSTRQAAVDKEFEEEE